jgi:hypothetical protein
VKPGHAMMGPYDDPISIQPVLPKPPNAVRQTKPPIYTILHVAIYVSWARVSLLVETHIVATGHGHAHSLDRVSHATHPTHISLVLAPHSPPDIPHVEICDL